MPIIPPNKESAERYETYSRHATRLCKYLYTEHIAIVQWRRITKAGVATVPAMFSYNFFYNNSNMLVNYWSKKETNKTNIVYGPKGLPLCHILKLVETYTPTMQVTVGSFSSILF